MSFKNEDLRRIYNAILGIPPTFYTGFANYDLKQIYDAIIAGSGGGGMQIGLPISGADPNRVLFSDAAGVLNQDPLFNFDNLSKRMYLGEAVGNTARLNMTGFGATNATKSISIKNSATTETFSMSDSGIGLISNSLGINGGIGGSTYLGQIMRLAVNDFSRFGDIRIGGGFGAGLGYIQTDALNAIEFSSSQIKFCNGWIASANVLKIGTTFQRGRIEINTFANFRAVSIQADAAQVVPLVEFRNSANTQLSYIGAKGEIYVGSGTINASAAIEADSTTQGFLMPRMTQAQILAIATPANGLMAYNTDLNTPCFYNGTSWQKISHANM